MIVQVRRSIGDEEYAQVRAAARGAVEAMLASHNPDVRVFRAKYLSGRLLSADQARTFLLSPDQGWRQPPRGPGRPPNRICVVDPADDQQLEQWISVHPGSPLDALRKPAESTARRLTWSIGIATWFVLTGQAPYPVPIAAGRQDGRLTLSVEPWVPADLVATAYRDLQRAEFGGIPRPISLKNLELAIFLAERFAKERRPWRQLLDEWNTAGRPPDWVYTGPDAVDAMQRDWLRLRRALWPNP